MTNTNQLGAKMGPRIADLTSRAVAATKDKTAGITHRTAVSVVDTIFRGIGAEQRDSVGDLVKTVLMGDTAPEWAHRIGDIILQGKGQWGELVVNTGVGQAVSGSFLAIVNDALAPEIQGYLRGNPNTLLDLGAAVRLVAQGIWDAAQGMHDGTGNGYDTSRIGAMIESSYQHPGLGELLQLRNRGLIDGSDTVDALKRAAVHPKWWGVLADLRHYIHSPADLALGVLKGVIDHGEATTEGEKSGLSSSDMSFLEDITGEPPGIQELLFLYRRGLINRERLVHGIRQSRLRVEWTDAIEALRYVPMSAAGAVTAAVQNHLDQSTAKRLVAENGIDPQWYDVLYETEGNPPGPHEMLDLLNRGEVNVPRVEQALRESRLKNKYIPDLLKLRRQLLTTGQISLAIAQGIMTREQGIKHWMDQGYTQDDAAVIAASATISRQARQYELTQAQIETLYLDRAITRKDAQRQLEGLGYDASESDLILLTQDLKREHRYFEAAINRVHASFIGHKIDETQASGALDTLKLSAEQIADLLALWRLEKETNVAILTVSQTQAAFRRGIISDTDALDRFAALGYASDDALILLELVAPTGGGA